MKITTAKHLLAATDAGTISPDDVPDFTWECGSAWADEANGIVATTLTLTLANGDTLTDSWETTDHLRGWECLTTIAALHDAEWAATWEWVWWFEGWTVVAVDMETEHEVRIGVHDLAERCPDSVQSTDPEEWTRVVIREIEGLLNGAPTGPASPERTTANQPQGETP